MFSTAGLGEKGKVPQCIAQALCTCGSGQVLSAERLAASVSTSISGNAGLKFQGMAEITSIGII